ncbi:MAG: imidazole glycerol phosphate synthase subunit HisH [Blastocatellia bacterium]|nr:MAG: imidazole glycerol phosphate synthase subunit HisH [Blastocatellia bacterium]
MALIDYRAGNLTSVKKAFAAVGADLFVPTEPADLDGVGAIVVPGVGHFAATETLTNEWVARIRAHVDAGRPLLGICLGMQWLFEGSDEAPERPGLHLLEGRCYRLSAACHGTPVKVPHVGWNAIDLRRDASIVKGVAAGAQVYFTHSFVAPITEDTVAVTEHGQKFAAIVQHGHVAGVQFHPEKSGEVGLTVLRNFLRLSDLRY